MYHLLQAVAADVPTTGFVASEAKVADAQAGSACFNGQLQRHKLRIVLVELRAIVRV
jgi:hypothetical protein